MRVHFKFKFDSENDHGVLTIFLNDSGCTECEREIASCSQTVQITPIVEFASGKSMHIKSTLISARNLAHNFSV